MRKDNDGDFVESFNLLLQKKSFSFEDNNGTVYEIVQ